MNKKTYGGFFPLIIIVGIFVLLFFGTGAYIIKRNLAVTPTPLANISPILTSRPTPTSVAAQCVIGGCSGELCLSKNQERLASICIYEPHYACYKKARCEVQTSGACGWTQTPELVACITTAQQTPTPTPSRTTMPAITSSCPPCIIECIELPSLPPGCHYEKRSACSCSCSAILVCENSSLRPVVTPVISEPVPILTLLPTPTQSSSATPVPSPITDVRMEADDSGFYPAGVLSFPSGTRVKLTFVVRTSNVYYGGLDFRSSKFSTIKALPGQTVTVQFVADSSFVITSYWPISDVYKASLQINVQ